jgi:hypothetical protein
VIYSDVSILGTRIEQSEPAYADGKDIYSGGLPKDLQHVFVQYRPRSSVLTIIRLIGLRNVNGASSAAHCPFS